MSNVQPVLSNLGPSLIKQARVSLSNADIKRISGNSPWIVELVHAPGLDRANVLLRGYGRANFSSGAYNSITSDDSYFGIPHGFIENDSFAGLFGLALDVDIDFSIKDVANGLDYGDKRNLPINLDLYNGDGALTEGHDNNYLIVTVIYMVYNVVTGLFET